MSIRPDLPPDFAHIRLIRTDQVPPETLLQAWESCRNELVTARICLKEATKQARRNHEEIAHYRGVLTTIAGVRETPRDPRTMLVLACSLAEQSLLAYADRPRKRTWRDRIAQRLTTWRAR